jgi:hypothetical protein
MGSMSNFTNGFSGGVLLRNKPIHDSSPGKVFWVGNNSTLLEGERLAANSNLNGKGGTFLAPFSTLDYAIGQCSANRGDVIYIRPGYTQSMTASPDVYVDVAGVSIIGLGKGSKRAKFTYDAAGGGFVIGASNVHIENLWFVPSVTAITAAVTIEAAGDNYSIVGCRFADAEAAGTDEFNRCIIHPITVTNGLIQGNYFDMGEAGAVACIQVATPEEVHIYDNFITGDYSTGCIVNITAAGRNMNVGRNVIINGVKSGLNAIAAIVNVAGNELNAFDNLIGSDVATFALMITNYTAGVNLGNRYTDDIGGATTAVDRSASVVPSADA